MMIKIACYKFILLFTVHCWGMNAENTNREKKRELFARLQGAKNQEEHNDIMLFFSLEKELSFIKDLLRDISLKKEKLTQKPRPREKLCERTISGNDWFVISPQTIVLKADRHIVAPSRDWHRYNCDIMVTEVADNQVSLKIVPDTFPVFSDTHMSDASWKAIVWLEEYPNKDHHIEKIIPSQDLQAKLDELTTCENNLCAEKSKRETQLDKISSKLKKTPCNENIP